LILFLVAKLNWLKRVYAEIYIEFSTVTSKITIQSNSFYLKIIS